MRQMKRSEKKLLVAFLVVCESLVLLADVSATVAFNLPCSEKYIAKVSQVLEKDNIESVKKIEVHFDILEVKKGHGAASVSVEIIKNGPMQFKKDEIYSLELNNGWFCSASLVTK